MTKDFLKLMKKIAVNYNIKITENAPKGGIFYRDENDNLIELSKLELENIIDEFCTPQNNIIKSSENTFNAEEIINFAA